MGVRPPIIDAVVIVNVFDQAEVGDLDAAADQEQVLGLDVEVLQRVLIAHVVERIGGVAHERQQLFAGNSGAALSCGTPRSGP